MRIPMSVIAALGAILTITPPATAAPLTTTHVASGFSRPLYAVSPPGDTDRLFVVEQHTGRIRILDLNTGVINPNPFLTVGGLATGNEQGLLGLAFHPDYADNGLFYINYTGSGGTNGMTRIVQYRVSTDPDIANSRSSQLVMRYDQPFPNHNAGWLGFGPDGYLYITSGDGGSGNDPGNRAQDITNQPLGKMMRVDVSGDDFPADIARNYAIPPSNPFVGETGDDEIWAYGLRNPWRASFDRATGDFYIADVGQSVREEVHFQPADSLGGENYGWRILEGTRCTNLGGGPPCDDPGLVSPIHEYSHVGAPDGGASITGGYVYRGDDIPDLDGTYFFADFISEQIWSFRYDGVAKTEFVNRTTELMPNVGSIDQIASFVEDARGELYIVDLGGEIFKIVGPPRLPGDTNGDRRVDLDDLNNVRNNFGGSGMGDANNDGVVDLVDLNAVRNNFGAVQRTLVPEPSTFALIGLGLVLAAIGRRRGCRTSGARPPNVLEIFMRRPHNFPATSRRATTTASRFCWSRKCFVLLAPALAAIVSFALPMASRADEPSQGSQILIVIGEDEYHTAETLPVFAARELVPRGFQTTIVHADADDGNHFSGLVEALSRADLVLISIRRRTPPQAQLNALRRHLSAGGPLIGIRTASHAFALRPNDRANATFDENLAEWPTFDPDVFGGAYSGHHGAGPPVVVSMVPGAADHPILRGTASLPQSSAGSLYKVSPLADSTTALLTGRVPGQPAEPVAWTNVHGPRRARIFYTSLGHRDDFDDPSFRSLLVAAIEWGLDQAPAGQ